MGKKWHTMRAEEVISALSGSEKGISEGEAIKRLATHGPNELAEAEGTPAFVLFFKQFKSFLIYILIFAVIISYIAGELLDAAVIGVIIILNAVLGFVQEYRAGKAMDALRKMSALKARVMREGIEKIIDAREVVPGDILIIDAGDKVAADCRLVEVVNLKIDEAALTGESAPVLKDIGVFGDVAVAERRNMCYMNTTATYGRGRGIAVATGMQSEFGKIAEMIQGMDGEQTPLMVKMSGLGKFMGVMIIAIMIFLVAFNFVLGQLNAETFLVVIALAVAAIPEGLPAIVTITLALGMKSMAKNNAIVRKMSAVETLGSTNVICSDKTGTLTKNEMVVREVWAGGEVVKVSGEGYETKGELTAEGRALKRETPGNEALENEVFGKELDLVLKDAVLCNNAALGKAEGGFIGDPTEVALLVLAKKGGYSASELKGKMKFAGEVPFDSERKRMSVVYAGVGGRIAFSKGAAESVLETCTKISINGKEVALDKKMRANVLEHNSEMARRGLRVLGFAYRNFSVSEQVKTEDVEKGMVFAGLVGMMDAPREEVIGAIKVCRSAGIEVIMVTGDHKLTAEAVAKEIGLLREGRDEIVTGNEIDKMSAEELEERIERIAVFARVSPKHKVMVVDVLRRKGKTIAMTGDGVNDAPALKNADIGIAMGITGTDVSKEASDVIITDDNFATIVKAVEEGRRVYHNIRAFVRYLLAANFGEIGVITIATVVNALLFRMPLPLLPIQILWLNLVTDGLPALALGNEKLEKDAMKKPPVPKEKKILHGMLPFILVSSVLAVLATLAGFMYGMGDGVEKARTMAFTALVMFELVLVFNCRSEKRTMLEMPFKGNKSLIWAVGLSFLLHIIILYIPFFHPIFQVTGLNLMDWGVVAVGCLGAVAVPYLLRILKKGTSEVTAVQPQSI